MRRIRVVLCAFAATSVACASHKPKAVAPAPTRDTTHVSAASHPTTRLPDLTAWVDSAVMAQSAVMAARPDTTPASRRPPARGRADSSGTPRTP
jgi:hypothetical protein